MLPASGTGAPLVQKDNESDFSRDSREEKKSLSHSKNNSAKLASELSAKYPLKFTPHEVAQIRGYFEKFVQKLYKIYKQLNVKVVSYEVLNQELSS